MYVDRFVQGAGGGGRERICLATRPHWFRVIEQGAGGLPLIVGGIALFVSRKELERLLTPLLSFLQAPNGRSGGAGDGSTSSSDAQVMAEKVLTWGGAALLLLGALLLLCALLKRHFTEYAVTVSPRLGARIIKVQGVFSRQLIVVPVDMINDLALREPLLGRLLGWGDIEIETGNDYKDDRLERIPDPQGFYQLWKTLLDHNFAESENASGADAYQRGAEPSMRSQGAGHQDVLPAPRWRRRH
jgi:hypothetical protein